jgi:type 1 glutamine amidotransferase
VVTGGHPFDRKAFFAMLDVVVDGTWRHLEQPPAAARIADASLDADVVVFYDMPGVEFTRADPPVRLVDPAAAVVDGFDRMLERGVPMVFLHHAIAGWPTWDAYARLIGGRFHYAAARFEGVDHPASGYRHDVTHEIEVVDPAHPICAGLDPVFTLTDELYLFPVIESGVVPLLRSRASFSSDEFFSADLAIRGERDSRRGWDHPAGSALVAWTRREGNSPVAYIQFGDGPDTYADPNYRTVLGNALRWAAAHASAG